MTFWDEHAERSRKEALEMGGQNDTAGVCAFCALASDDVLLGVCAECAPRTSCGS